MSNMTVDPVSRAAAPECCGVKSTAIGGGTWRCLVCGKTGNIPGVTGGVDFDEDSGAILHWGCSEFPVTEHLSGWLGAPLVFDVEAQILKTANIIGININTNKKIEGCRQLIRWSAYGPSDKIKQFSEWTDIYGKRA